MTATKQPVTVVAIDWEAIAAGVLARTITAHTGTFSTIRQGDVVSVTEPGRSFAYLIMEQPHTGADGRVFFTVNEWRQVNIAGQMQSRAVSFGEYSTTPCRIYRRTNHHDGGIAKLLTARGAVSLDVPTGPGRATGRDRYGR